MKKLFILSIICIALLLPNCIGERQTPNEDTGSDGTSKVGSTLGKELQEAADLLGYFDDDKDPQRRAAAVLLGIAAARSTVDLINAHLVNDRDAIVRSNCAWAAGRIKDLRSLPILLKATRDNDKDVRHSAIIALASYDDPDAIDRITEIAKSSGGSDSLIALKALGLKSSNSIASLPKIATEKMTAPAVSGKGKEFYIDASSGNDENPGTKARPLRSMAKGISMLKAGRGDTLFATSGKGKIPFRENVLIGAEQRGTLGAPTTIRNWPGRPSPMVYGSVSVKLEPGDKLLASAEIASKVLCVFLVGSKSTKILDQVDSLEKMTPMSFFYDTKKKQLLVMGPKTGFGKLKIEACIREDAILVKSADHVHIIGFTAAFAQDTGIDFSSSYHGVVMDATVHDCDRHGVFFYYSPFGTVTDSEVYRCRYQGISIRSSSHTVIHNSFAHHNGHDGILFLYDSVDCFVSHCRLEKNSRGIGFINGSTMGRVFGNTFFNNKDNIVFDKHSSTIVVDSDMK